MKKSITTRRGYTTSFIVDGRDYFAANLECGGARVGMVGGTAFDIPAGHETHAAVIALADEEAAEALFDSCCDKYL